MYEYASLPVHVSAWIRTTRVLRRTLIAPSRPYMSSIPNLILWPEMLPSPRLTLLKSTPASRPCSFAPVSQMMRMSRGA